MSSYQSIEYINTSIKEHFKTEDNQLDTTGKINEKIDINTYNYFITNINIPTQNLNKTIRLLYNEIEEESYILQELIKTDPDEYSQFNPQIGTTVFNKTDNSIFVLTDITSNIQYWNKLNNNPFDPSSEIELTGYPVSLTVSHTASFNGETIMNSITLPSDDTTITINNVNKKENETQNASIYTSGKVDELLSTKADIDTSGNIKGISFSTISSNSTNNATENIFAKSDENAKNKTILQNISSLNINNKEIIGIQTNDTTQTDNDDKIITTKKYVDENNIGKKYYVENVLKGEIFNSYTNNIASGDYSHAEGLNTNASGNYSHAAGNNTIADQENMTAIGKYNTENNNGTLFAVGNGSDEYNRQDTLLIKNDGSLISGNNKTFFEKTTTINGITYYNGITYVYYDYINNNDNNIYTVNYYFVVNHYQENIEQSEYFSVYKIDENNNISQVITNYNLSDSQNLPIKFALYARQKRQIQWTQIIYRRHVFLNDHYIYVFDENNGKFTLKYNHKINLSIDVINVYNICYKQNNQYIYIIFSETEPTYYIYRCSIFDDTYNMTSIYSTYNKITSSCLGNRSNLSDIDKFYFSSQGNDNTQIYYLEYNSSEPTQCIEIESDENATISGIIENNNNIYILINSKSNILLYKLNETTTSSSYQYLKTFEINLESINYISPNIIYGKIGDYIVKINENISESISNITYNNYIESNKFYNYLYCILYKNNHIYLFMYKSDVYNYNNIIIKTVPIIPVNYTLIQSDNIYLDSNVNIINETINDSSINNLTVNNLTVNNLIDNLYIKKLFLGDTTVDNDKLKYHQWLNSSGNHLIYSLNKGIEIFSGISSGSGGSLDTSQSGIRFNSLEDTIDIKGRINLPLLNTSSSGDLIGNALTLQTQQSGVTGTKPLQIYQLNSSQVTYPLQMFMNTGVLEILNGPKPSFGNPNTYGIQITTADLNNISIKGNTYFNDKVTFSNGQSIPATISKSSKSNSIASLLSACDNNSIMYSLVLTDDNTYIINKYTTYSYSTIIKELNKDDYPILNNIYFFNNYLLLLSDYKLYYINLDDEELKVNDLLIDSNINKIVIDPRNNNCFYILYNSYDYFSKYNLNNDKFIKYDYQVFTSDNGYNINELNIINMIFYNNNIIFIHEIIKINDNYYIEYSICDESNKYSVNKKQFDSVIFTETDELIDTYIYDNYIYFLIVNNGFNNNFIKINTNNLNDYIVYNNIINDNITKYNQNIYYKYNKEYFYLVSNNFIYYYNVLNDIIQLENKLYADGCKYITYNQDIYMTNSNVCNLKGGAEINGNILLNGTIKTSTLNAAQLNISDIDVNVNKTILHNTLIYGNIENYQVGQPVFIKDNKTYTLQRKSNDGKYPVYEYIEINDNNYVNNPINQIPMITNENNSKFIGVITAIYPNGMLLKINDITSNYIKINNDTIDFATHGDYIFKVDNNKINHQTTSNNSKVYEVGDEILYDGRIVDPESPLSRKLEKMIIGTITYIPENKNDYVSVFKN